MTNHWNNFLNVIAQNKRYPSLNGIIAAQAALETGFGESKLCLEHNNFWGMKFRPEMEGKAYAVTYETSSEPTGSAVFCGFNSIEEAILGYFHFLTRSPYKGWQEHVNDPIGFIKFIGPIWCSANPNYVNHVIMLYQNKIKLDPPIQPEPIKVPEPFFFSKAGSITFHTSKESVLKAAGIALDEGYTVMTMTKKEPPKPPHKFPKVLINPGHAGSAGARGKNRDIKEEEFTELQAVTIKQILDKEPGIKCDIIRQNEVGGLEVVGKCAQGYDMALSLHFNAANGVEHGVEFLCGNNPKPGSLKFGEQVCKEICNAFGYKYRGKSPRVVTVTKNFDETNCPIALLLEAEFVDDETNYESFKQDVIKQAEIIGSQIIDSFK